MSVGFDAVPYTPLQTSKDCFALPFPGSSSDSADFPAIALSSRSAGSMEYEPLKGNPNRDFWLERRGFKPGKVLSVTLAHSRVVRTAAGPEELESVEADGILTSNREMCAVVTVADCMPIFLYDRRSGVFGVLHSGWKGTGILKRALEVLKSAWGTDSRDISITFGPCIGTCCYPVDEARARVFSDEFGSGAVTVIDGKPRLDLIAANLSLAERCGALTVNYTKACTSCGENFGSFRRQGPDAFVRMAACIGFPARVTA